MRQTIETAPRDGNLVILGDDASGTYDVAHWSAEAGEWVGENGEPSKITPTHWYPRPRDQFLQEDDRPPRRFGVLSSTAALVAVLLMAVGLMVLYFQVDAPETLLSSQGSEVLANELAEDQPAKDWLNRQLQAEAASSAQLLGQERQNSNAARQELTASTVQHRQALDEERARGAALARELATAQRENEKQATLLKAGQLIQAEAAKSARLIEEVSARLLEEESGKAAALALEVAAAQKELAARTEQHRQALEVERARSAALASELAAAQRAIETQATLLKAGERAGQLKEPTKSAMAELRKPLQQEHDRAEALATELANARRAMEQKPAAVDGRPGVPLPAWANSYALVKPAQTAVQPDVATENSKSAIKPREPARVEHKPRRSYGCQHFRTYDPASGTYMGYDGRRHSCP